MVNSIKNLKIFTTGMVILMLAACSAEDDKASIEQEIASIMANLGPAIHIRGQEVKTFTLQARMKELNVPGVSIAVMKDHKLHWARGFGLAKAGTGEAVTPETLFQAASISKPVTGLAILTLVEEGKIDLDTDINQYLERWKLADHQWQNQEKVTLRRLMSHTAGTTVSGFPGYVRGSVLPSLEQILDGQEPSNTPNVLVDKEPGEGFRYSGGGTTILQMAMEDISGERLPAFVKSRVLDRVGAVRSTFIPPSSEKEIKGVAFAHDINGKIVKGDFHIYPEEAAAGLWTNPTELLKIAADVQISAKGEQGYILSPEMTAEMLTHENGPAGLGFFMEGENPVTGFSHAGGNEGFKSFLFAHTTGGDGFAIMTNGENGGSLHSEIRISLAQYYGWDEYQPIIKTAILLSPDELKKYLGIYKITTPIEANIIVSSNEKGLVVEVKNFTPPRNIWPESKDAFFALNDTEIHFLIDENDEVQSMALTRGTVVAIKQK